MRKISPAERSFGRDPDPLARIARHLGLPDGSEDRIAQLAELGIIASGIAHEINNALTPVLGYAQAALASPQDCDLAAKANRRALEGSRRACSIARMILELGRAGPGSTRNTPDFSADAAAIARQVIDECAPMLREQRVEVHLDLLPGCQAALPQTTLHQVVLNLVLNSVNAMRGRGGQLTIRTVQSGRSLLLEVTDTGCGMTRDEIRRALQPFCGGNAHGGSGLGLAICLRLLAAVGGSLVLESQPGCGTTARLVLPRAQHAAEATAA